MQDFSKNFWAIGGGKGGVGKSITTVMLGSALAKMGKKVIIMDADLGGSNLHTLVGIRYPKYTLADFLKKAVSSLEDVVLETPVPNMKMICGADDILGIANPKSAQKNKIFNHLQGLKADFILIDLGAGSSFTTIDFFLYAPQKMVVLTPQVTSIQNAYGFIKSSVYRKLSIEFKKEPEAVDLIDQATFPTSEKCIDSVAKLHEALSAIDRAYSDKLIDILNSFNIHLLVNMVRDPKEKNVAAIIKSVSKNYLGLDLEIFGSIPFDGPLGTSINNMASFLTSEKEGFSRYSFYELALKVLKIHSIGEDTDSVGPVGSSEMKIGSDLPPTAGADPSLYTAQSL
ncbi:MAG: P-loop NTPase [Thermodesulfobacteriota bacterium]